MKDSNSQPINPARQLLNKLRSPFLFIASDYFNPQNPQNPISPVSRQIEMELESLSGGCLALADNSISIAKNKDNLNCRKLRIYHRNCGKHFFMSVAKVKAIGSDKACPYCNEPQSLFEIGGIVEIQQFVLERSRQKAFFGHRNCIGDISDVYDFNCISCRTPYQAPFEWFLRDSPGTNACPCCKQRMDEAEYAS